MMKLPNNVRKLEEKFGGEIREDRVMGYGVPMYRVEVSEPGNGFPIRGIYDIVHWSRAFNCVEGWNLDDGVPYASAPIFIRPI